MQLEIHHSLRYRYQPAVFFEPTVVRLRPRCDFAHELLTFELAIDPAPAGQAEVLDAHGNVVTWLWFNDQHEHLHIDAHSQVELRLSNPFNFLVVDSDAMTLPMRYSHTLRPVLAPFRQPAYDDPQVIAWAERLRDEADGQTLAFLTAALRSVHQAYRMIDRDSGEPLPPSETMRRGSGACRDLALLFMELCRSQGLASRFVSGYQMEEAYQGKRQLHAWAEVYLPGGGWRGYDPSYGLVVADQHVVLAAGRTPTDAAPTCGAFRHAGARSEFAFHLEIQSRT